jgi:tetratricopeptide (TPR) repeat protein
LQIISIVTSYTYSLQTFSIDQKIKYDKVNETRQFVSKAINAISKPDSSLLFFRGLLSYQLHNFAEAYEDFSAAIRKEQSAMYYTARGRTLACLSLLEEAMDDLSTAIKLDEH